MSEVSKMSKMRKTRKPSQIRSISATTVALFALAVELSFEGKTCKRSKIGKTNESSKTCNKAS